MTKSNPPGYRKLNRIIVGLSSTKYVSVNPGINEWDLGEKIGMSYFFPDFATLSGAGHTLSLPFRIADLV